MKKPFDMTGWAEAFDLMGDRLPSADELTGLCRKHRGKLSPTFLQRTVAAVPRLCYDAPDPFMHNGFALVPFVCFWKRKRILVCFPAPRHMCSLPVRIFYRSKETPLGPISELVRAITDTLEKAVLPAKAHAGDGG